MELPPPPKREPETPRNLETKISRENIRASAEFLELMERHLYQGPNGIIPKMLRATMDSDQRHEVMVDLSRMQRAIAELYRAQLGISEGEWERAEQIRGDGH